jgi:hypothetical protein
MLKSFLFSLLLLLASGLAVVSRLFAQEMCTSETPDPHFARQGHWILTASTGIPYTAIGEIAYGLTEGTTIGIIGGQTPHIPGVGLRWRSEFYETPTSRIYGKAPILYYPHTLELGGEPWFLTWPTLTYEWKNCSEQLRYSVSLGMVAAACAQQLLGLENEHAAHHSEHVYTQPEQEQEALMKEALMGGLWNTIGGGITLPITSSLIFSGEAALVMDGIAIADERWVGGPPVLLTLQISKVF